VKTVPSKVFCQISKLIKNSSSFSGTHESWSGSITKEAWKPRIWSRNKTTCFLKVNKRTFFSFHLVVFAFVRKRKPYISFFNLLLLSKKNSTTAHHRSNLSLSLSLCIYIYTRIYLFICFWFLIIKASPNHLYSFHFNGLKAYLKHNYKNTVSGPSI